LPPRHLEAMLQSLVRNGILKGIRGPHGGYQLARDPSGVTANDILRAASTGDDEDRPTSKIVTKVVLPVLSVVEQAFKQALSQINLNDMVRYAQSIAAELVGTKAA
jgi:Rrf2 family iron-sulfur cluster assembly transcriptional regulator